MDIAQVCTGVCTGAFTLRRVLGPSVMERRVLLVLLVVCVDAVKGCRGFYLVVLRGGMRSIIYTYRCKPYVCVP